MIKREKTNTKEEDQKKKDQGKNCAIATAQIQKKEEDHRQTVLQAEGSKARYAPRAEENSNKKNMRDERIAQTEMIEIGGRHHCHCQHWTTTLCRR